MQVRAILKGKKYEFTEVDLTDRTELRVEIEGKAGTKELPQLFIDDRHVCNAETLVESNDFGELDTLLAGVNKVL